MHGHKDPSLARERKLVGKGDVMERLDVDGRNVTGTLPGMERVCSSDEASNEKRPIRRYESI
jgi:hypothetical protein